MIEASTKTVFLQYIFYTHYLAYFQKSQKKIQVLINFESEVNTITPIYIIKLGLIIQKTDVNTPKIYDLVGLVTYRRL